jgi:hypothetical protein
LLADTTHLKDRRNFIRWMGRIEKGMARCWRWKSVNLAMSLPSVLAWLLYLIHWY